MGRLWNPSRRLSISAYFTPTLRAILIGTGAVFVLQIIFYWSLGAEKYRSILALFALSVSGVFGRLRVWQLVSYAALHAIESPFHILGNMFLLWMFGRHVEEFIGPRRFLKLYLFSAVFAAILCLIFYGTYGFWRPNEWTTPIIGASGAVCAVMAAFATLFPEQIILVFFVLPMKIKHAVFLFAALEALVTLSGTASGIATIAHLAGFGFGFVFIRYGRQVREQLGRGLLRVRARRLNRQDALQERLDGILAKVAHNGLQSLSWRERRFLKKASRKLRQR